MAITKRPVGEARAVSAAGNIVGQAQRAAEERARAWELEKMEMRSRQEFAAEMRAREWDVQKMEIASRIDFERQEKERLKTMDLHAARSQKLRESIDKGLVTKDQVQWQLDMNDYIAQTGDDRVNPNIFKPQNTLYDERKQLEAVVGEEGRTMPLTELRNAASELGFPTKGTSTTAPNGTTTAQPETKTPQYAQDPKTGRNIVSYDDGETWQDLISGVLQPPIPEPSFGGGGGGTFRGAGASGDLTIPQTGYAAGMGGGFTSTEGLNVPILSSIYNYLSSPMTSNLPASSGISGGATRTKNTPSSLINRRK